LVTETENKQETQTERMKAVRKRASYDEWLVISLWLDGKPSKEDILRRMHHLLNDHNGYGSMTKAGYSDESLDVAMADSAKVAIQMLPCPDEAPLTSCPHCGREYRVDQEKPEKSYTPLTRVPCLSRHRPCGGIVRFICWADELVDETCQLGLKMNDMGECETCPWRRLKDA